MRAARALLFATPVYFWNVSGLMKTLWDRMLPLAGLDLGARPMTMRPLIRGVRAGTIVIQEEAPGPTASICRLFFERNLSDFGMVDAGSVYAYGALRRGDVRRDAASMAAARKLGARLVPRRG
jgi:multimeric flavodoxin WrbA